MTTLTQTHAGDLGPSKSLARRFYGYVPIADATDPADGVLAIFTGRSHAATAKHYGVSLIDTRFGGLTFVLERRSGEPEHYEVFVPTAGKARCSCYGHCRHGICKHADALADLVRTEEIPHPSAAPEAAIVSAAVDAGDGGPKCVLCQQPLANGTPIDESGMAHEGCALREMGVLPERGWYKPGHDGDTPAGDMPF